MKMNIVRIGNSRGIRIPKAMIEQCGFGEAVDVSVKHGQIVIASHRKPREGWNAAFEAAGSSDSDELLLENVSNEFDDAEWQW